MASATEWHVGQIVDVQARTWAGINRLGGTGKITKIHYSEDDSSEVEFIDVKYIVNSGGDTMLRPHLISAHEDVSRSSRRRQTNKAEEKPKEVPKRQKPKKKRKTKRPPSPMEIEPALVRPPSPTQSISDTGSSVASPTQFKTEEGKESDIEDIPASVSNIESASEDDDSKMDCPVKQGLQEVYEADMRCAEVFVDELQKKQAVGRKNCEENEELQRFAAKLCETLTKNDGMLEIELIPELLDDFPSETVHSYVDQLCAQNKIMRTDGCIYQI